MSCFCNSTPCTCDPCSSYTGCPVQLDSDCVIYHKYNNQITELSNLGLTNGATLELILESIDTKVAQLNVINFNLPCLRVGYVVNTMQQFTQAVDSELCLIKTDVAEALTNANQALVATDSSTIDFTTSGTLGHGLTGSVKISANSGNRVSAEADGLYVAGQTLSVDYTTKELSISNGNTVDLSTLVCGASGFLGNLASDPTAADGQYWYNTTSDLLKIKVNGVVKTITTS